MYLKVGGWVWAGVSGCEWVGGCHRMVSEVTTKQCPEVLQLDHTRSQQGAVTNNSISNIHTHTQMIKPPEAMYYYYTQVWTYILYKQTPLQ